MKVKTFLLVLAATMFLIAILISGLFTIANEVAYLKKSYNKTLLLLLINYKDCLENASQNLENAWENRYVTVGYYNYKIYAPLLYVRKAIDLINQAHSIALLCSPNHSIFRILAKIRNNNTWRDIVRALEFVYGHMYYHGVKLGEHKIDVELVAYYRYYLGKISQSLSTIIKVDGFSLENQISKKALNEINALFDELQGVVDEYLSKPGSDIR
ncbi:hypothetical protein DRO69_10935 [Candidatus Bathyarchaeota archaeon]|nr:MAG: hypothetical protein DRO69_10935 [Candidatus Bathyarchaeota archaeon]